MFRVIRIIHQHLVLVVIAFIKNIYRKTASKAHNFLVFVRESYLFSDCINVE